MREVHEAGINKNAITIAVIGHHEDPDLAYAMGAHFVLRKPLSRPDMSRDGCVNDLAPHKIILRWHDNLFILYYCEYR